MGACLHRRNQPPIALKLAMPPCCAGIGRKSSMPGYSAECVSGHHDSCTNRDCRCMCSAHPWNRKGVLPATMSHPGTNLVCTQCPRLPRAGDFFCRSDGSKLVAGKRCTCGHGAEPDDLYCGGCGAKFGGAPLIGTSILATPVPELSDEELIVLEAKARSRPSDVEVPPQEVH